MPREGNLYNISLSRDGTARALTPTLTVHIIAKNTPKTKPHVGKLKVVKKIDKPSLDGVEDLDRQQILKDLDERVSQLKRTPFTFSVEIIGNFEYNEGGRWVKYKENSSLKKEITVTEETAWTSNDIRWYGSPPKYIVNLLSSLHHHPAPRYHELFSGLL